MQSVFSADQLI